MYIYMYMSIYVYMYIYIYMHIYNDDNCFYYYKWLFSTID